MTLLRVLLLLLAVARLAELALARRNTQRLLAAGAHETGRGHYPLIVALHAAWLLALLVAVPADAAPRWGWLALFLLLQLGRAWVLLSLGRFWTTRIISLPGAPLIRRGPYRFLRHPNYLIVELEIVSLPLAFGADWIALVFGLANAALLLWRVRLEETALAGRRA
jgi:methyltransferase